MNERIKQLAEQAFNEANNGSINNIKIPKEFVEKFAELIVQECAEIAYGTYWENPEGVRGIHIKDAILENFEIGRASCRERV